MKILYHHRTQAEDAQGIHIYEMVNAFKEIGHSIQMVSLVKLDNERTEKTKGRRWELVAKLVPNFLYELMELVYNIYGYWLLSREIKRERPDFIYERYSLNTFCGVLVSKKYHIPLILEVNAPLYYEQQKVGKLTFVKFAKFSERWICSNASRTIVVTGVMKDMLVQEGVPSHQITVMHNGINPNEFNVKISGEAVRRGYGIDPSKVVLGFIGWFRPWHGLDRILKVFNEEKLDQKDVHLLFCGDGPAYAQLYEYVKNNKLQNAVTFTGPIKRDDVPAHIAAFDFALQPSVTSYASPMKIFEYLGMGKGVIAPRQENIMEILTDGKDSLLFDKDDENALKNAFLLVVKNEKLRKQINVNSSNTINEKQYFWKENARRVVSLLEV